MTSISHKKAEEIVEFALLNGAVVEQKEFKNFDRTIINTTKGLVSLKSTEDTGEECTLQEFHGFDNNIGSVKSMYKEIELKGFKYD